MPKALRKRPETPRSQTSNEAKTLADSSLEAGYLKDAVKYLRIAHENDPGRLQRHAQARLGIQHAQGRRAGDRLVPIGAA